LQAATSSRKQPQEAASSRKKSQAVASSCSRSHGSGQGRCQGRCQRRPQSESCLSTAALLPPASTGRQRWRTRQRACAAWASLEKWSSQNERSTQKGVVAQNRNPPHTTGGITYIYTPGCPHMARAAPVAVTSVLLLGPILAAAQSYWPETADTDIRARGPHYPGPPKTYRYDLAPTRRLAHPVMPAISRIGPFFAAPAFASICRQPPGV
jgi:hypothetical protein